MPKKVSCKRILKIVRIVRIVRTLKYYFEHRILKQYLFQKKLISKEPAAQEKDKLSQDCCFGEETGNLVFSCFMEGSGGREKK